MVNDIIKSLQADLDKGIEAFKRDLTKVRTGRASLGILDGVRVDYYGTPTPLNQVAKVTLMDSRTIGVTPFEKKMGQAIEKAIRESDLGLNPATQGDTVRVPMPSLTEERRKDMVKLAKKVGEECKVAIRKCRHDALDLASSVDAEGGASADEVDRAKKKAEELVSDSIRTVDSIIANKEKDILEV